MFMRKSAAAIAVLALTGVVSASAATMTAKGTGVGKDGDIKVQVTFKDGKINAIKVLQQRENPVLSRKVFTDLKRDVIRTNSVDLDVISGATFSSRGFLDAVKNAARKAKVKLSAN
jgi:urocanate reductase